MTVRLSLVVAVVGLLAAACGGAAPAASDGPAAAEASLADGPADAPAGPEGGADAPPLFGDGPGPDAAGGDGGDGGTPGDDGGTPGDGPGPDAPPPVDSDGDGISDADEARLMRDYLPYLSVDPDDGCPRAGLLYRLRPHPQAPALVFAAGIMLFETDCGAGGHVGDNEGFALTIDPTKPAPTGILAVRAISHRDTLCENITTCGSCAGLDACTTATRNGAPYPVVFFSLGKHGGYMSESACDGACFLTNWCSLRATPVEPPLVNAGEPDHPLVSNLTTQGFITAANGWTEADLMNFDPWADVDFGGAGNVRSQLLDAAFVTPTCQ
jgi:hypothetical protein